MTEKLKKYGFWPFHVAIVVVVYSIYFGYDYDTAWKAKAIFFEGLTSILGIIYCVIGILFLKRYDTEKAKRAGFYILIGILLFMAEIIRHSYAVPKS